MLHSIQWKLIFIYLLLIFIAIMVISVYLLDSLEKYYLNDYKESMESQSQLVGTLLRRHMMESDMDKEYTSSLLEELGKQTEDEITLLDKSGRVIATTGDGTELEGKLILEQEITRALSGDTGTDIRINPQTNYRKKYMAMPIQEEDQILGVVYTTASLEKIDVIMDEVRKILLSGTLVVMVITSILIFLLSKTITDPVKELTSNARAMAQGNFHKKIEVRSEDEIGNLGKMFNYMALKLEETLKEISSEKGKIESILDQMTDGVVVIDEEYKVIHINPAAEKMLGLAANELRGSTSKNLLTKFISLKKFNETVENSSGEKVESIITSQNDQSLKAQVVPYKSQGRGQRGVIIVLNDITEEEELIKMKQEFIENVSHELRTPLTSIKSYVETLQEGALEDTFTARKFLKVIENETSRMVSMVKDLLVLSRLDKREEIMNFEDVEINSVVEKTIESIENWAKEKDMNIKAYYFPNDLWVLGDKNKIIQVITNILENAVKYTPEGGEIRVTTSLNEQMTKVSVEDNGIGIPDSELPRIFERFYRVDKGRSREKGGTGLGLSISREIINAHGGKIKASSKEEEGTIIELYFPSKGMNWRLAEDAGEF